MFRINFNSSAVIKKKNILSFFLNFCQIFIRRIRKPKKSLRVYFYRMTNVMTRAFDVALTFFLCCIQISTVHVAQWERLHPLAGDNPGATIPGRQSSELKMASCCLFTSTMHGGAYIRNQPYSHSCLPTHCIIGLQCLGGRYNTNIMQRNVYLSLDVETHVTFTER